MSGASPSPSCRGVRSATPGISSPRPADGSSFTADRFCNRRFFSCRNRELALGHFWPNCYGSKRSPRATTAASAARGVSNMRRVCRNEGRPRRAGRPTRRYSWISGPSTPPPSAAAVPEPTPSAAQRTSKSPEAASLGLGSWGLLTSSVRCRPSSSASWPTQCEFVQSSHSIHTPHPACLLQILRPHLLRPTNAILSHRLYSQRPQEPHASRKILRPHLLHPLEVSPPHRLYSHAVPGNCSWFTALSPSAGSVASPPQDAAGGGGR